MVVVCLIPVAQDDRRTVSRISGTFATIMTSSGAFFVLVVVLTAAELLPEFRLHAGQRYGIWDGTSRVIRVQKWTDAQEIASVTSHSIVYNAHQGSEDHDVLWLEVSFDFISIF